MSETIIITGGAGFIGSHLADRLLALGHRVRVLDNLTERVHRNGRPAYLSPAIEFIEGDVRHRDAMVRALRGADVVFHFAAYQDYQQDFSTFFHTNAVSTALIYELIVQERLPVRKVVVASSQFVQGDGLYRTADGEVVAPMFRSAEQLERGDWEFRDAEGRPMQWLWTPETHAGPANAYAMSKFSQEQQAMRFGERYAIPSTALRFSIVQGSRQSFYNTYSGACRIFSLHYYFGKAPTIYEDGRQRRDFVNIHDVIDANVLVMNDHRTDYQVFNVGGGTAWTVSQLASTVAQVFGREDLEPLLPGSYRYGDTRHACSDISKLRALGWEPKRSMEQSVREYVAYLNEQTNVDDILAFATENMRMQNVVRQARPHGL
ncbi:MAG: NAD-dependent epimerase/dehydratase family protein [Bacteroidetes bacterium]|nr:NAD-dependent epimerase/dehydratase family protein [Bacteroidota bacterium]